MTDTLADRLNNTSKVGTGVLCSDEVALNQVDEHSSHDLVNQNGSLTLEHEGSPENVTSRTDGANETEKTSCNVNVMSNERIIDTATETVQASTDFPKSQSDNTNSNNIRTEADNEVKQNCDNSKEESETNQNNHIDSKGDDEDDFEDFSEESGSDAEYESAEEGEEINTDKQNLKDLEETLTEEEKEERRNTAQAMKEEGNELFRLGSYKSAIRIYSRALRTCPLKYPKDRAIMYSNRGACKMRLEEYEDSIKDCSKALELHPQYMKALMRRAELYEKTDKLDEALTDFQKILEMDPSQHTARAACIKLPDQIKERNEKLKEEMMGKLKDLGNMVLRPFGLSTNNFQMQQDPNTGGYSVKFVQNTGQQ